MIPFLFGTTEQGRIQDWVRTAQEVDITSLAEEDWDLDADWWDDDEDLEDEEDDSMCELPGNLGCECDTCWNARI